MREDHREEWHALKWQCKPIVDILGLLFQPALGSFESESVCTIQPHSLDVDI